jgi:hypothetical protein
VNNPVLTQIIWWAGNAVQGLLLYRALRGHFFTKYPVFYTYLSYVMAEQLFRYYYFVFRPAQFSKAYWSSQFVSVSVGYCVVWEIFRQALSAYPGAARLAKTCLSTILLIVLAKVALNAMTGPLRPVGADDADLEKYLRIVQAALLVTIAGLVAYYAIPLGRNVKGMLFGYGTFIGLMVMQLALHGHLSPRFAPIWQWLAGLSYWAAMVTWCATLWSYHPNPRPVRAVRIESDYRQLSAQTGRILAAARASVGRAMRP